MNEKWPWLGTTTLPRLDVDETGAAALSGILIFIIRYSYFYIQSAIERNYRTTIKREFFDENIHWLQSFLDVLQSPS